MQALLRDIRFAFRLMRKRLGTSLLVIAALVLGIGANSAIFSVVNAVLLRPLPLFEPDRIVRIYSTEQPSGASLGISYPEYLDWKAQAHSFVAISAMRAFSFTMTGIGSPQHLKGTSISPSGFLVFGVTTALGRSFTESDDRPGAEPVVILNYAFWQRTFGGDVHVLGRPLRLDDENYTIVGVLQPTKVGVLQYPDVWLPNAPFVDQAMMNRGSRFYFPAARLKRSVTLSEAQAEMDSLAAKLAIAYPATNKDAGARLVSMTDMLTADGRRPLSLLLLASGLICLMACVNIAIVSVATTVERRREMTIRLALGASRINLLRQLLVEALVFVCIGGALALTFAKFGLMVFLHSFPNAVLRLQEATIDHRVIAFTITVALIMALVIGVAPALYASRLNLNTAMKEESFPSPKSRSFGQGSLIALEVSLATALSLVTGLLGKSLYQVTKTDLGFNPHQVLAFQIELPPTRYKTPELQALFQRSAIEKLSAKPGMARVSGISNLPLTYQADVTNFQAASDSPEAREHLLVEDESVLPHFFKTMSIPVLQGRDFTDADRETSTPVAIIDDVLAAKFWPKQSPLGKRLRLVETAETNPPWREIIGVVGEIKHFGPESRTIWPQVYVPEYQVPTPLISFLVNTTAPKANMAIEETIHLLDPDLPIDNFQPLDALLGTYLASRKASIVMLSSFTGVGIVLGMIGIYGIVSSSVVRRRREAAIRRAVGATPRQITFLLARPPLLSAAAGMFAGSVLVVSFTQILRSFLFGITALAPELYLAAIIFIAALTAGAIALPVNRLLRVGIQDTLRV